MDRRTKIEIDKMNALFERMNGHYTYLEAQAINENIEELDARGREDIPVADFPSEIQKIKGGTKCTIGYVSSANLDIPQIKMKNPETNRMKNYPDWPTFSKNIGVEGVGGVIKFSRYCFNWRGPENMRKHYNLNYVTPVNDIRAKRGLAPIEKRPRLNAVDGEEGLPSYSMQDTGKGTTVSKYFLIGTNGHIIKEISYEELKPYFKKSSTSGVADLRKMNASDAEIKAYENEIAALKFSYRRFNFSSIAYVITTIGGVKKRFFNDELSSDIRGTGVNPEEFIQMAKNWYKLDVEKTKNEAGEEFDDTLVDNEA